MLKRPFPGVVRRVLGIAGIVALTASSGYAAWAGQATSENNGPEILVDMKFTKTNLQSKEVSTEVTQYLVHSGELTSDMPESPVACTLFLPQEQVPDSTKGRRLVKGQISWECLIREDGKVVAMPAAKTMDGRVMVLKVLAYGSQTHDYELELNATVSEERIAGADTAVDKR